MSEALEVAPSDEGTLVDAVRLFAHRELDALKTDREGRIDPALLEGLRSLGVFGITLPPEHGGMGLGLPVATRVVQALAEVDRSVATTVGLHLGLGTRALVRFGDPQLQAELVPALATGECLAAFGTTEPGAGSDLSRLSTRVFPDGSQWVVTGEKAYVTNGGIAGLLTVTASSPGVPGLERGLSMLVVRTDAPGVTQLSEERKLGLRGSSTTGFILDAVEIPRRQMLGTPATGQAQLDHTLCWGRTLMSAGCVGAVTDAVARAVRHVTDRRQFGRALIELPVVRGQLARAKVVLGAMAALVEIAAAQEDEAGLHRWSVSAKIFCSEQGFKVIDTALQLHGGSGYLEDTGLPMMLRDMRVTRIFEGANDVLLTHLGGLELQSPAVLENLPARAQVIAGRVERRVRRLRGQLGVRVFRRPELLHQLGIEVAWRDAVAAGCRQHSNPAWQQTLCREAMASLRASERRLHPRADVDEVLGSPQ